MTKSVLITGCSSGIGHALAREFKHKGFRVFATARKIESIADLAALGIETLPLEATSLESITALKEEVVRRTNGELDYLVNNAGRNYTVPALEVEAKEVEMTFVGAASRSAFSNSELSLTVPGCQRVRSHIHVPDLRSPAHSSQRHYRANRQSRRRDAVRLRIRVLRNKSSFARLY
jgi:NAD(P)-dependent dehydrogenase (short-subunit alcohol dehydrogenase family)